MKHPFYLVDVFTSEILNGNPLAVVFGADGLTDAQMLAFARCYRKLQRCPGSMAHW